MGAGLEKPPPEFSLINKPRRWRWGWEAGEGRAGALSLDPWGETAVHKQPSFKIGRLSAAGIRWIKTPALLICQAPGCKYSG